MADEGKKERPIKELLHRRADLSSFVVHFTRDTDGEGSARANLKSILEGRLIKAGRARGMAIKAITERGGDTGVLKSQEVVCITEVPLEHAYAITQPIEWRDTQLSSYGIGFGKMTARRKGVNPIWYIDQTNGREDDWLCEPINRLIEEALDRKEGFVGSNIAQLAPFIESMGTWPKRKKEFWWEREWRCLGQFGFEIADIAIGFCPADEVADFECFARELAGKGR